MNKQLLKDLAELEAAEVISAETAEKINDYYLHRNASAPNRLAIILGILGALLIGSGIILIVASMLIRSQSGCHPPGTPG